MIYDTLIKDVMKVNGGLGSMEEGNAAAVMLPMEKVLQLKAVKVVSRTIISPSSPQLGFVFQRSQQIIVRRFQRQSLSLACR